MSVLAYFSPVQLDDDFDYDFDKRIQPPAPLVSSTHLLVF